MALISERCSIGIGNILATHIIPQKVNLSPNELNRLLIPQQRKQFPILSYKRGFNSKKKMLHTVRAASEEASEWATTDNRRFLHASYRVTDLERSIKYYTEVFGMKLLERRNLIGQSAAFVGFGAQDSNFVLELFYRTDDPVPFEIGNGFGHFGISTPDVNKYVEEIKAKGGNIVPPPTNVRAFLNAFAADPDGYLFELLERDIDHLRLSHLNLSITNLESSTNFYIEALGMKLLWENSEPEFTLRLMGYSDELERNSYEKLPTNFLELTYRVNGPQEYSKGNAYSHLSIGTDDVNKSAEALNLLAEEIRPNIDRETESSTTKSTAITFLDPDCWKIVLFDNAEIPKEDEANQ